MRRRMLVVNWAPVGLANLRPKIAVAVIDSEQMEPNVEADAFRTAAILEPAGSGPQKPAAPTRLEDGALAVACAALGALAPEAAQVTMHPELGARCAAPLSRLQDSTLPEEPLPEVRIRELQA